MTKCGEMDRCEETEPTDNPMPERPEERDGNPQTKKLDCLLSLLGLGTAATTVLSLTASYSLHLTRAAKSGYPLLFLTQISAADIVPTLPSTAMALLVSLPALHGMFKDLSLIERLSKNGKRGQTLLSFVIFTIFILLPPVLWFLCFPISIVLTFIYSIVIAIFWAVITVWNFGQHKNLNHASKQASAVPDPEEGSEPDIDEGHQLGKLALNSIYVGMSIVIAAIGCWAAQAFPLPAPLRVFLFAALLAICSMFELECCMDKIREAYINVRSTKTYSTYFFGLVVALLIAFAFGVLMAVLPDNQRILVGYKNTVCESATDGRSQTRQANVEAEDEYLLLDTFANGNAVATVNNAGEGTNSYRLISLVDGYSVRADGV